MLTQVPSAAPEATVVDFTPRRRPGPVSKIAQLPTELRALVNQLLDQGHTYEDVVEEMASTASSLTPTMSQNGSTVHTRII